MSAVGNAFGGTLEHDCFCGDKLFPCEPNIHSDIVEAIELSVKSALFGMTEFQTREKLEELKKKITFGR